MSLTGEVDAELQRPFPAMRPPNSRLYIMSKTIRVPDWFHDHVAAYKRKDETY